MSRTLSGEEIVRDLLVELRARGDRDAHVVETHVSRVLLGDDVFKTKKRVTLPFLDFASIEAREAACRAEVKLNRRLAPRTYLGVVPIRWNGRVHTFRPEGPVVDWAVHMRRLDDAGRADFLLSEERFDTSHVDAIARRLATFHAEARTSPYTRETSSPEAVEAHALDNFVELEGLPQSVVKSSDLFEIRAWELAFIRGHRELFERRIAEGHIRDGHGDLRLEHVFFTKGLDFEVIDGVEFDERYRHSDTCADLAFLTMDLRRLGRADLAERLLATYATESNDFDLYRLVDFYESYRAMIRAKIAALVARDPATGTDGRIYALSAARRAVMLALACSRRSLLPPTCVVVAGGIASGKTTLAAAVAETLGAPIVEADRTRKHMLGLHATDHADAAAFAGPYDPRFTERVYAELLARAGAVLASGRSVVIDASFRSRSARLAARELAATHGAPFRVLECVASPSACRARLAQRDRTQTASDGRVEILDDFAASFEAIDELCSTEHFRIDTSSDPESAAAQAKALVGGWPERLAG